MHPWIEIAPLGVRVLSGSAMTVIAAVVALTLSYIVLLRDGLDPWRVRWALVAMVVLTPLAGRAHYLLANWQALGVPTWRTFLSPFGLHAPGAIAGAVIGGPLVAWLCGLPLGRFLDGLALPAGVGAAIARMGCFLHGCCFGSACELPWGVRYPKPTSIFYHHVSLGLVPRDAEWSIPVHPLQIYFALAGLGIAAYLVWLWPRRRYGGQLALRFIVLFAASSAALEFLRDPTFFRAYWGPLPQLEWVWLGILLLGLILLAVAESGHRRRTAPPS
jgi:phosphatidylglycerol:prolipoprotein diacylglycerol transferase